MNSPRLIGGIAALVIAAGGPRLMRAQDSLVAARSKGSPQAPVTVYEMADFQCPVCLRFTREIFPKLDKEFVATGKVRWIFVHFPVPELHPNALAAAEFAECAARQKKFWPVHDMLYAKQEEWAPLKNPVPFFTGQIMALGLRREPMMACLQSGTSRAIIQGEAQRAAKAGATGTPAFYIEGGLMVGLYPESVFRSILDSIYKVKTAKRPAGAAGE